MEDMNLAHMLVKPNKSESVTLTARKTENAGKPGRFDYVVHVPNDCVTVQISVQAPDNLAITAISETDKQDT